MVNLLFYTSLHFVIESLRELDTGGGVRIIKIIVESFDGSEANHDWDNDRICSLTPTWRTLIVGHESICRHRDPRTYRARTTFHSISPPFFSRRQITNSRLILSSSSIFPSSTFSKKERTLPNIERQKLSTLKNHLSKHGVVFMHSPWSRSRSLEENGRSPHRIMHIRRANGSPWKSGAVHPTEVPVSRSRCRRGRKGTTLR